MKSDNKLYAAYLALKRWEAVFEIEDGYESEYKKLLARDARMSELTDLQNRYQEIRQGCTASGRQILREYERIIEEMNTETDGLRSAIVDVFEGLLVNGETDQ
jgi:hypothetical protein